MQTVANFRENSDSQYRLLAVCNKVHYDGLARLNFKIQYDCLAKLNSEFVRCPDSKLLQLSTV